MAFSERELRFTFSGAQPFSGAPSGSFSAAGLRAVASIQAVEGRLGVQAQVKIWGLSMDQMNAYSTAIPSAVGGAGGLGSVNLVIEAGDFGGSLSQVFNGLIWQSYIDLTGAPDSAFVVSVVGIVDAATPTAPQSQPGAQNAEDLISAICAGAGFTFHNNGAHAVLRNQATYGSAIDQIERIARAADFRWMLKGKTLSIWPQGGTIDDVVIDVGPNTDPQMVGYPAYWEAGLVVTSLFNPEIQVSRQMNVVGSSIPKANGLWAITKVQHDLTTMVSKGPWFTTAILSGIGT